MTVAMNPARMPCPSLLARGQCDADSCPYNHSKLDSANSDHSAQTAVKARMAQILTGASGQFVGARKGANTVPIAHTAGGLPTFLQKAAQKLSTIKSSQRTQETPSTSDDLGEWQPSTGNDYSSSEDQPEYMTSQNNTCHSVTTVSNVEFIALQQQYEELCRERSGLESFLETVHEDINRVERDVRLLKERLPAATSFANSNPSRQCSTDLRQLVSSNRTITIQIKQAEELANVHEAMIAECRQKYGTLLDRIEDSDMIYVDKTKHEVNELLDSIERQFQQLSAVVQRVRVDFTMTARNRQNELLASEGFTPGEYLSVLRNSQDQNS